MTISSTAFGTARLPGSGEPDPHRPIPSSNRSCDPAALSWEHGGTMKNSAQTKPSIVFAHGLWADGSCFSKVIPTLQAEGYQVMASQHSLDTPEGDVATLLRA